MLRHVTETTATVWVETAYPTLVSIRTSSRRVHAPTFTIHGHHYALVYVDALAPGSREPYEVWMEAEGRDQRMWPPPAWGFPPSVLRTLDFSQPLKISFGGSRRTLPHDKATNRRYGLDALKAFALHLAHVESAEFPGTGLNDWPSMLLFLGNQVYADETSQEMRDFIGSLRDLHKPPGEEIASFEEYAYLYRLAWTDPAVRWLLSTVSSAMMFNDREVRSGWNISPLWRLQLSATAWWTERIYAALSSYWVYQHLGNLSHQECEADPVWRKICDTSARGIDGGPLLEAFASRAHLDPGSYRWSFARDLGATRLVVLNCRAGRVLNPNARAMHDVREMAWLEDQLHDCQDHVVLAASLPLLLPTGLHHLEAWNEAVASGAWGFRHQDWAERTRQGLGLEHFAAFQRSFERLTELSTAVAHGDMGPAPATVLWLAGGVSYSYLAEAELAGQPSARVVQAACSPIRDPVRAPTRYYISALSTRVTDVAGRLLCRSAKVKGVPWNWHLSRGPWFDHAIATLEIRGRTATLVWATPRPGESEGTTDWAILHRADVHEAPR